MRSEVKELSSAATAAGAARSLFFVEYGMGHKTHLRFLEEHLDRDPRFDATLIRLYWMDDLAEWLGRLHLLPFRDAGLDFWTWWIFQFKRQQVRYLLLRRRPMVLRALMAFTVMLFLAALHPAAGSAQSCTNCTLYARTELNLREGPSLDSPVLRFIPAGAALQRAAGAGSNGFAPVTYEGVSGWTVALGLVMTPEEIDAPAAPSAPAEPAPTAASEIRVTLAPLMLRSGPGPDAEPILVIPEGVRLTLTRVGAENGYVTADYDGVTGWVYADLIAREDEVG